MIICNKCSIEQPTSNYETYWHSTHQKSYTRKICRTCINEQKRIYRESIRLKKKIQPEVPELQPDPFENHPDYKQCLECKKWKHRTQGYWLSNGKHYRNTCLDCTTVSDKIKRVERRKQEIIDTCGGNDFRVEPNEYTNEVQRDCIFSVMEELGWKFNTENNIWYKEGFKTKDGKWIKFNNQPLKPILRRNKDIYVDEDK